MKPFAILSTDHGTMIALTTDCHPAGFGVGWQLLRNGCYDPEEVAAALRILHLRRRFFGDGVVAIDCGANIGVHSVEWAGAMTGYGEVLAFEAQERIFYALAGNIAINNRFNCRAVLAAVGDHCGTLEFRSPDYGASASFGSLELTGQNWDLGQTLDAARMETVRLLTIDSLALNRLDFLKIDIEGMEMAALTGAGETIGRCRPVVFAEYIKSDKAALLAFFKAHGYGTHYSGNNIVAIHADDPTAQAL